MDRRNFLSQSIAFGLVGTGVCCATGCGTVFHRERVGQPHSRDIDWKVAGLNGLGLLFFFVPGVAAFAVDFYTGAIYLPYEAAPNYTPQGQPQPYGLTRQSRETLQPQPDLLRLGQLHVQKVHIQHANLNRRGIETAVAQNIGRPVTLTQARVSQLAELDDFSSQYRLHHDDSGFGVSTGEFFARART